MKVSIVTATYNCASTLLDCLDSVAGQTQVALEHIAIDGASTDGTSDILKSRQDRLAAVVSEVDQGIYDGLNKGVSQATGEVVGLLHGDDIYAHAGVLASVVAAFDDSAVQAVYGDLEYVARDDTDRVIRYWRAGPFDPISLRRGWMPPHPTLFLRRSLYERFGGFDNTYRIAADYDFMLRVLADLSSAHVVYIPRVLIRMRVGGASNRSFVSIARKSREDYRALRSNNVGGPITLFLKNARKLPQLWQR